jgi:hypothetical protein
MKMTFGQKAAAWAVVQAMFAGCGGGGSSSPTQAPTPAPVPTPAPSPTPTAPTISAQAADATVLTGATPTFSITATGTGDTYQWKKNGTDIAGATSSSYTTPAAIWSDDSAQYTVVVTNAGGTVTSNPATEHLKLSTDQQVYETFALGTGTYESMWNLNYIGAQSTTTNYLIYDYAVVTNSPLTHGPQTVPQLAPANYTRTLAMPAASPTRVLRNGVVLVVPGYQQSATVTYVGSAIQVDELASDNQTVGYSYTRSNYASVALTGLLHAAPTELTRPYNSVFANTGVLDTTTTWASGAAYDRFTETNLGDRYNVFDCTGSTTGATPNPCNTGTTLAAAMTAGETSTSDAVTYHSADGTFSTAGGVPMWVATTARPRSAVNATTVEYRVYFQLNGNVYTGALIKDGAAVGGGHYLTNPTDSTSIVYLDYQVRLNSAAVQSITAGSLL